MKTTLCAIFIFVLSVNIFSQEYDITPYIKKIDEGKRDSLKAVFYKLKTNRENNASIIYLEGLLQEDAAKAIKFYKIVTSSHPASKYADAAAYRLVSYYYLIGDMDKADTYLTFLKTSYPKSSYTPKAENYFLKSATTKKVKKETVKTEKKEIPVDKKSNNNKKNDKIIEEEPGNLYSIQTGAFTKIENAKMLKTKLYNLGYYTYIKEKINNDVAYQIVFLGKYKSKAETEKVLKEIKEKLSVDGKIVPYEE
ncbi:MAG: SPOR domain-containing protein [Bacteroidota bacterium]|nr:SPOR domain-containing protein [Bacteroidota bacterium]